MKNVYIYILLINNKTKKKVIYQNLKNIQKLQEIIALLKVPFILKVDMIMLKLKIHFLKISILKAFIH